MEEGKTFSLEDANLIVPWLFEAAQEAETQILAIQNMGGDPREVQKRTTAIIQHWAETVMKLGGLPKQPFTVDFDSGTDYFCWDYPEDSIQFRHDYHAGLAGRHPIEEES